MAIESTTTNVTDTVPLTSNGTVNYEAANLPPATLYTVHTHHIAFIKPNQCQ